MPENITSEIRNKIKSVISSRGKTLTSFINDYNSVNPDDKTTTQNITNKLTRGSLRLDEFIKMMDSVNYDVILRDRENEKNITVIEPK